MSDASTLTIDLSLPSELGYEVVAREAIAAFARRHGVPADQIEDVKTALSEACINAIEHGNSLRPDLRIYISCSFVDDRLTVEVLDQGVRPAEFPPCTPLSIADKLAGKGSLRGMGLMLISQLCEEAGFVTRGESGNCFRFAVRRQRSPGFGSS